jgi:type II secretory ATPase GspE/PulE/Tfp pilus assembly ATPase PilB-like protein
LGQAAVVPAASVVCTGSVFPRGEGFYLNWISLAVVLGLYLAWLRASVWLDRDARTWKLNRHLWNLFSLAGSIVGLVTFWLLPWFPIAVTLLIALSGAPLAAYLVRRNAVVPETERLLTERHLRSLLNRYFQARLKLPEPAPTHEVAILLKPGESRGDKEPPRIREASKGPGYDSLLRLLCAAYDADIRAVHLVPAGEQSRVLFRSDGVWQEQERLPRAQGERVVRVLKRLADLNLQERRKPQQGEFAVELDGRRLDLTVHSAGNLYGERVLIRLRDRHRKVPGLDQLEVPDSFLKLLKHPQGLLVLCGPGDSGRTTLACACALELASQQRRVAVLESEPEYHLDKVAQHSLASIPGTAVADKLRHLLAQSSAEVLVLDCPVDAAGLEAAYEAASEILVLLVLEAEDVVAGLGRLLEGGLTSARLAKKLMGGLGLRLVRLLCPQCKVYYRPNVDVLRRINLSEERVERLARPPEPAELVRNEAGAPVPCSHCRGIGFRGRKPIYEVLVMTERLRELLRTEPALEAIRQLAVSGGMRTLETEMLELVISGATSVAEMLALFRRDAVAAPLAIPAESSRVQPVS